VTVAILAGARLGCRPGDRARRRRFQHGCFSAVLFWKKELAIVRVTAKELSAIAYWQLMGDTGSFDYAEIQAQWGRPDLAMNSLELSWQRACNALSH
jgi:hypothetical protein